MSQLRRLSNPLEEGRSHRCFFTKSIFIVLLMKGFVPDPHHLWGLLFTALLGLGNILFNPEMKKALKEADRVLMDHLTGNSQTSDKTGLDGPSMVYRLECWSCGSKWEMMEDEWVQKSKA